MVEFQPTTFNERTHSLDIIRGFSLLGILLVNIIAFNEPLPHVLDLHNWFKEAEDIIWYQTLDIYVQSSFYPLFSMLFGYGIAMQYIKAEKTGALFYSFASRRFMILFVLGMIHAFLIWWGDILAMYAFCGFFLLLFIRFSPKMILTFGLVIYGLMHALFIGVLSMADMAQNAVEASAVDIVSINNAITAYGFGNWTDAFKQRLVDLSIQMSPEMWLSSLFTILPYMLIGASLAKWRLIERAKDFKALWISMAVIGIGLGLFIKSTPFMYERTMLLDYLKVYIGGPILSIGYMALIVCICMIPFIEKFLHPIGLAGRMSLTIYIMQSIICSIIFYAFGFGLYGRISIEMSLLIALVIFIVQILFALVWFIKFKQGPLEAAVKKITYKKSI